ncbi:MAG: site-2 protease family protein [Acidobacteriota bacterium]
MSDPTSLHLGLSYSLPLLFILLCHEMGHYLACRYYRLPATPPMFLPLPFGLGTLGAFIRIRSPIRRRRELFDIGAAGPLAGFLALIPFLLWGIAHSEVVEVTLAEDPEQGTPRVGLGRSLAMAAAMRAFHGTLGPEQALDLHPAAMAAWVGLLATALNLLPLGQLDGGHVLYAVAGRRQRRWAPVMLLLLALGGLLWPVWWLWCLFIALTGLRHPPVRDENAPLGAGRRWLAAATLLLLVLSFMPVPVGVFFLPAPG